MKRILHLICILLAIDLLLAVALVWLWTGLSAKVEEAVVFSSREATEVTEVAVRNPKGEVHITMQDGGYLLDGVPTELIDVELFISYLEACATVAPTQTVLSSGYEKSAYGLEEPAVTVSVTYSDAEMLTLYVGDTEPVSGEYYCLREGDEALYLLSAELVQSYSMTKEELISFAITPKLELSSALSALADVTFSGEAFLQPVKIESVSEGDEQIKQLARSFGAATHIVRGAGVYELDQTVGIEMLTPLCGMNGGGLVYYGLSAAQEEGMGFAEPYLQVDFEYRAAVNAEFQHYTLRFLPATEDGTMFYVNAKDSGRVYLIERQPFFDLAYEDLLLRWFVSPLLMDVTGMTVETDGVTTEFVLDQTDAKNPTVTMNGQELSIELFRDFFRLVGSAAHDGSYLGVLAETEEPAVMTITYHYSEGKPDDVLKLTAGDTRRVNVYVNGVCEFAMKDAFVQRVQEALAAMQNGTTFDTNW